jgi:hypothetical protein
VAREEIRLQRCKNEPEIFDRFERNGAFQKKFGVPEITPNTENKLPSQVTDKMSTKK